MDAILDNHDWVTSFKDLTSSPSTPLDVPAHRVKGAPNTAGVCSSCLEPVQVGCIAYMQTSAEELLRETTGCDRFTCSRLAKMSESDITNCASAEARGLSVTVGGNSRNKRV